MIKQIFKKLFCLHKWEKHASITIKHPPTGQPMAYRDTLICSECGKIKTISL